MQNQVWHNTLVFLSLTYRDEKMIVWWTRKHGEGNHDLFSHIWLGPQRKQTKHFWGLPKVQNGSLQNQVRKIKPLSVQGICLGAFVNTVDHITSIYVIVNFSSTCIQNAMIFSEYKGQFQLWIFIAIFKYEWNFILISKQNTNTQKMIRDNSTSVNKCVVLLHKNVKYYAQHT
jgi:hypothetical protein